MQVQRCSILSNVDADHCNTLDPCAKFAQPQHQTRSQANLKWLSFYTSSQSSTLSLGPQCQWWLRPCWVMATSGAMSYGATRYGPIHLMHIYIYTNAKHIMLLIQDKTETSHLRAGLTFTTGSLRRWFNTFAMSGTFIDRPATQAELKSNQTHALYDIAARLQAQFLCDMQGSSA